MKRWLIAFVVLILSAVAILWLKYQHGIFLSSQARGLIKIVHEAFLKVEAAQSKLPPVTNDRDKLERMYDLDQCGREVYGHIDFSVLAEAERDIAKHVAWNEIDSHDQRNQKELKAMIPREGWFKRSKWGTKAADGAFYVAQHAGPELMRLALARLEPLLASGEVDPFNYARMYDRVAVFYDHRPQRYGTQFTCRDGAWQPYDIEDPVHVDERRKAIGLTTTAAEDFEAVRKEGGTMCR